MDQGQEERMRVVADIMTTRVLVVPPELSIAEANWFMLQSGISAAPVVGRLSEVLGMVSKTDLVRHGCPGLAASSAVRAVTSVRRVGPYRVTHVRAAPDLGNNNHDRVGEIMTTPLVSVEPQDPVAVAVARMLEAQVHRVVVLYDSELVGLVTSFDLVRLLAWDLTGAYQRGSS